MICLRQLTQDARFALRTLRRIPAFTATVVLTLALGIGMTSAVFSVFNAVLLRPLAYPHPERLLWLSMSDPQRPPQDIVLGPDFVDWKGQATSFEQLVAYDLGDDPLILAGTATQERIASVSEGFWELSGVDLAHGRVPAAGERDTLLVSHEFFEARLGGDAAALGTAVTVSGTPHTIVGVLPRGFPLQLPWPGWPGFEPRDVSVYRTVRIEAAPGSNRFQMLHVVGRLKGGVTIEQARAELETIRARAAVANPEYPGNRMALRLVPLSQKLSGEGRRALGVLLSAVVLVLLIACANVASLMLGRASARQKEMAIRAAVGAGRARIVRQLLVESLILALVGGSAGLLLAKAGLSLVLTLIPYAIPRLIESSIDGPVLAFTLGVSLVSALIFGVGPALALGTVNLQNALKLGSKPSSSLSVRPRAGRLLVAGELALAVVLLTGAGLLIKSFWLMTAHPAGFEPGRVLTMKVQFSGPQYDDDSRRRAYVEEFLRRSASVPGVLATGISTHGDALSVALVEGAPVIPPDEAMLRTSVLVNSVSAGSARAVGMRLLRGRWISESEPPTNVVINESFARRDFPAQDPVGRRIRLHSPDAPLATIVGVVADLRYAKLDEQPAPEVYVSYSHEPPGGFTAVVRTSVDPAALAGTLRTTLSDIDRALPVFDVQTLEQALADAIAPRRFNLLLLAVFAAAALGLAMIGVYGVIAYDVTHRTHEIGIRMALGANRRDVVTMMVRHGAGPALVGIVVGTASATLLTRVMASLLYDVRPTDLPTFASAAIGLAITAFTASLVPALRAAQVDPSETLR